MITIYSIDVVTIAPNFQTFMKIFLSVMQVITIYLTNISIRKKKLEKMMLLFSVSQCQAFQACSLFLIFLTQ